MNRDNIIERVRDKMGIAELNAMQLAMSGSLAPATVLLSPTGSGKTLAFTIPMLEACAADAKVRPQAVVLAPSRELAMQITDVVKPLASPLRVVTLYGGHPMIDEVRSLEADTPDIVIATPGRLLDHLHRATIAFDRLRMLVLDEYDKSLELGFLDEMKRIVKRLGRIDRVILTSATSLADKIPDFLHLRDTATLDFTASTERPQARTAMVKVPSATADKLDTVIDLVASLPTDSRAIVFVNHRESAERVYQAMRRAGLPVGLYHGGLDQRGRETAIDLLNNGTTPVLISTDLASRGLDIADVDSVIHYHMAPSAETWTHRNGRTARQDADGTVYTIVADGETIPDYVEWSREYIPPEIDHKADRSPAMATIHFNAGRREKISRGDIVGYLINRGGLDPKTIGKISVHDHYALAAIPSSQATQVLDAIAPHKLKQQRVRVTLIS